jgi:hypothetical protein
MRELSSEAAALIRAGRSAFRPEAADRDRVLQSLTLALRDSSSIEDARQAETSKQAVAAQFTVKTWALGGLAVIVLGVGLVAVLQARTAPALLASAPSPASSTAPAEASTPAEVPLPREPAASARPSLPSSGVPRPAPQSVAHPPADSLPEEVRLLSRAEKQLNAGLAEDALRTLGEHERRFPNGMLAEERLAARVHALCALGRTAEARTEMAKLGRAYPRSPHIEGARRFCSIDASLTP